jgi:hypothetical protein
VTKAVEGHRTSGRWREVGGRSLVASRQPSWVSDIPADSWTAADKAKEAVKIPFFEKIVGMVSMEGMGGFEVGEKRIGWNQKL